MADRQPDTLTLVSAALIKIGIDIDPETKQFIVPPTTVKAYAIEESIGYLSSNTGVGRAIDPFEQADGNAWVVVQDILSRFGLKVMACRFNGTTNTSRVWNAALRLVQNSLPVAA